MLEVLVSMLIGLIVVGAVLVNYLGTGTSGTHRAQVSQMTEDAQVALAILRRDLQMAGYTEVGDVIAAGAGSAATFTRPGGNFRPVFACPGAFAAVNAPLWSATCDPVPRAESIEINYQATKRTSVHTAPAPGAPEGYPTDCVARSLAHPPTEVIGGPGLAPILHFTSNRYHVSLSGELRCGSPVSTASGVNAPQPLVDNVHDLRFWFGVAPAWSATDPAQRQPVRMIPTAAMTAADWDKVVSVRICVLMRSAEPVLSADEVPGYSYLDCAGVAQSPTDRRLYRAFHSDVTLRNRAAF